MKIIKILKISLLLLNQINKSLGNTYDKNHFNKRYDDVIDDDGELFTRECRTAMTDNLYSMKSCLEYLEGDTVTEKELNKLCDSFQDYYAKEGDDDEEEEKDDDENNDKEDKNDDLSDIILVDLESIPLENIPIMNMSNITKEEAEVLYEVTKVMINFDKAKEAKKHYNNENDEKNKDQDFLSSSSSNKKNLTHLKTRSSKSYREMCTISVKRWKEKCIDVSRIASIINTSLEIFYFRRESHCIRNQQNQFCTVVMNEIHQRAFNGTDSLVVPLTPQDRNNTCECYKENMTYLRDEYNSSIDPTVEKKHKPYSKGRKYLPKDTNKSSTNQTSSDTQKNQTSSDIKKSNNRKRAWEGKDNADVKKENQNDQYHDPSQASFINKLKNIIQMMMYQLSPFPTIGINPLRNLYGKNVIPSYRKLIKQIQNSNDKPNHDNDNNHNHNDEPSPDFINELRRLFLREFQPEISLELEEEELDQHYQKRMESDVNVQQLKKLINRYHRDMSQYMDLATCNITFIEPQLKNTSTASTMSNSVNRSHTSSYYIILTTIIILLLIQILFYYIL